jgi:hypothetical protein
VADGVPSLNSVRESDAPSERQYTALEELRINRESHLASAASGTCDSAIANKSPQGETHKRGGPPGGAPVPMIAGSNKPFKFASSPKGLIYGSNYVANVMVVDVNGTQRFKRATLDSGAEVSMVASDVVEDIGIEIREPSPTESAIRLVFPEEGSIEPLGQVEIEWCFQDGRDVYKSTFWVLDTEDFDILIGGPLISKHKLFKRKVHLWF